MTQELTDFAKGFVQGCRNKGMTFEDMQKSADYASELIPGVREELDCLKGADMEKTAYLPFLRAVPRQLGKLVPKKWVPKWMRPGPGTAAAPTMGFAQSVARSTPQVVAQTAAQTAAQTSGGFLPKLKNLFTNPAMGRAHQSAPNKSFMGKLLQKVPGARSPVATTGGRFGLGWGIGTGTDWASKELSETLLGPVGENSGWMRKFLDDPGASRYLPWLMAAGGYRSGPAQKLSPALLPRAARAVYSNPVTKSFPFQAAMYAGAPAAMIGNYRTQGETAAKNMATLMGEAIDQSNVELRTQNEELREALGGGQLGGGATGDFLADLGAAAVRPPGGPVSQEAPVAPGAGGQLSSQQTAGAPNQDEPFDPNKPIDVNEFLGISDEDAEDAKTRPGIGEGIGPWWNAMKTPEKITTVLGILGVLGGPMLMSRGYGGLGLGSTAVGGLLVADMMGIFGEPGQYTNMLLRQFGMGGESKERERTGEAGRLAALANQDVAPVIEGGEAAAANPSGDVSATPSAESATATAPDLFNQSALQPVLDRVYDANRDVVKPYISAGDPKKFDLPDVAGFIEAYIKGDIKPKQMNSILQELTEPADRMSIATQIQAGLEGLPGETSAQQINKNYARKALVPLVTALIRGEFLAE